MLSRMAPRWRHTVRRLLATLPDHKEIIMPKVSPTMTAGRLVAWKKAEGDAFEEGEDLADVESDKATMPISAREDGFIAKIFVEHDSPDLPLGHLLAITVEEEEHIAAFKDYQPPTSDPSPAAAAAADPAPPAPAAPSPTPAAPPAAAAPSAAASPPSGKYDGPVGPAIMRLLNEFPSINLDGIAPTGPQGRMLKGDVLAAVEDGTAFGRSAAPATTTPATTPGAGAGAPGTSTAYTDVPVSSMRRAIAKRLVQSKTGVPHRYASASYELDALLALRKRLNAGGAGVSVNDFVIKAVGVSLRRVPGMNVRWETDGTGDHIVQNASVDVSMAVAVDGGLITPIVKTADARGLREIAADTKALVAKARAGTLAPDEFEGGSFSVSNLGMFGVSQFSAIINPPQAAILAVGAGIPRAVMADDGTLRTVTTGVATLSSDARMVDEETAAKFLEEFSACLTQPENLLL